MCSVTVFWSPVVLCSALFLSSCVDPRMAHHSPSEGWRVDECGFSRVSVLSHLSQLGCQVDSYVFIQGVVRDISRVVQVVETIQSLPLL